MSSNAKSEVRNSVKMAVHEALQRIVLSIHHISDITHELPWHKILKSRLSKRLKYFTALTHFKWTGFAVNSMESICESNIYWQNFFLFMSMPLKWMRGLNLCLCMIYRIFSKFLLLSVLWNSIRVSGFLTLYTTNIWGYVLTYIFRFLKLKKNTLIK